VILAFCAIHLAAQGVLGTSMLSNQEAPLAELAKALFGEVGFLIVLALSFIAVWSTLSSILTLLPRVLYAGAKDGLLPDVFSKIHPTYRSPFVAIVFLGFLEFGFAASGSFRYLLVLVTGASLLIYFGAVLAFLKLRWNSKNQDPKIFKVPGGNLIGLITLIALAWVFFQLTNKELLALGIFILVLILLYIPVAIFKNKKLRTIKKNI
jgi:amino acid transporter